MRSELALRFGSLPERLIIGLSGGADSVALLCLLCEQRGSGEAPLALSAVHVHHGLREAADTDEAFVRALCAEKQVPLRVFHLQPPDHPGEGWARKARFACFREASEELGGVPVALAHNREDQAETVLLHLMRGAGLTGLSGMARETTVEGCPILRPLLSISRVELRAYLNAIGQTWREDETNAGNAYLRNQVRHQVLPLLETLRPGSVEHIARTAGFLREDERALCALAGQALLPGERFIGRSELRALPGESLRRRALRMLWEREAGNGMDERGLSAGQTAALSALADAPAGTRCDPPGGWHGYAGWQGVHLVPPAAEARPAAVRVDPSAKAWTLGGISLEQSPSLGSPGDGRRAQEVPPACLENCVLRTWETGDFIRPFGTEGRRNLQDYFTDRRVDAPFRSRVPLLCRGREVLLAGGVGAGGVPRYQPDQANVRLTWQGQMPWLR